jgi:O-methyltransferase involved in polyketide biosynthesis
MKGNEKIAFTAEAVAFMRDYLKSDKFSKYFITPKIKRRFKIIKALLPRSYLEKLFIRRNSLSRDLDKLIKSYNPQQIIEIACGYSPRGLIMTQKNPKLIYIETDFPSTIEKKEIILKEIEKKENITISKNHHLIEIDVINSDLYKTLKNSINPKKKTLVIAEALNSYLTQEEFEFSINNITNLLSHFNNGAYLSHETNSFLSGFFGKLLILYRNKITKTKSYKHFTNQIEIKDYFLNKGFKEVKLMNSKVSHNTLYITIKNN